MLYMIRGNPMHPLYGALIVQYVPVRVTRGALVPHRYTYAPPRCRTSQHRKIYNPLSVSLWNDLADPVFDGVGLAGFKSRVNAFYWPKLLHSFFSSSIFTFLFFLSIGWYCWTGFLQTIFNNSNNNNNNNNWHDYHSFADGKILPSFHYN